MKLLASDLPMESGQDQRLFLVGDEQEYKVCGGLISELRDTILEAMTTRVHEAEDERREREEAENLEKKLLTSTVTKPVTDEQHGPTSPSPSS